MKKIYLFKKEADGLQTTLGEYESEQAASNAAIEMCGTDGSIPLSDVTQPVKTAMAGAAVPGYCVQADLRRYCG